MGRAQAEVIGTILVIAVVVVTVGVAGATVLDAAASTADSPRAEIDGSVSTDSIDLTHQGGTSIPASELRLLVRVNGDETTVSWEDGTLSGGDDAFDPGERWTAPTPTSDAGAVVSITLIHRPSNAVLFETESNPRAPRMAAGDGGLAEAADRDGRIDPGDVGAGPGDGGSDTPEPPDGEPAPPDGGAFNDADGDGLYDPGETTYEPSDLYEFDDENADLVIPDEIGTLDRKNQDIDITAASITTNSDISADNAALTLTATDGDVDASGATLSSKNNPITIEASGTVDLSDTDLDADNGGTSIRASRILLTNGQLRSKNNPITLESTGDGDGEIVADGATITADNSGVTLTTSDGRDLSLQGATISSKNNPILIDSAGELDATGATITADNSRVTLRSSGGDLSIRDGDVESKNNPIVLDSAGELDATGAALLANNGNIEAVSRGDVFFDGASLDARRVTADLNGEYTLHVDGTSVNDDDDRIAYTPVGVQEDPSGSNVAEPA